MKTYGELYDSIDRTDEGFAAFCRGWEAAARCHAIEAQKRGENPDLNTPGYSEAQEAQLWGFYTGEIGLP